MLSTLPLPVIKGPAITHPQSRVCSLQKLSTELIPRLNGVLRQGGRCFNLRTLAFILSHPRLALCLSPPGSHQEGQQERDTSLGGQGAASFFSSLPGPRKGRGDPGTPSPPRVDEQHPEVSSTSLKHPNYEAVMCLVVAWGRPEGSGEGPGCPKTSSRSGASSQGAPGTWASTPVSPK